MLSEISSYYITIIFILGFNFSFKSNFYFPTNVPEVQHQPFLKQIKRYGKLLQFFF